MTALEALRQISRLALPALLLIIPLWAYLRRVSVYQVFTQGAAEGLQVVLRIFPSLLAMLLAIAVFRASGALELLTLLIKPLCDLLSIPTEVLPLALLRPLSGSGSLAFCTELLNLYGADSFIGRLASVMQGSTDTTFYILAVYFGSVGVKKHYYAPIVGLFADFCGFIMAFIVCSFFFAP